MKYFKNITIEEFFKSPNVDTYEKFIRFLKPINKFNGKVLDVDSLKFEEVVRLRQLLSDSEIESFIEMYELLYGVEPKAFMKSKVLELFHCNRFLVDFIDGINKREERLNFPVSDEQKERWLFAGGNRLNSLQEMGMAISIGSQFSTRPSDVFKWDYNEVYAVMLYNGLKQDINNRIAEAK